MEVSFLLSGDELYTLMSLAPGAHTEAGARFAAEALAGAQVCDLSGLVEKHLAWSGADGAKPAPIAPMLGGALARADSIELIDGVPARADGVDLIDGAQALHGHADPPDGAQALHEYADPPDGDHTRDGDAGQREDFVPPDGDHTRDGDAGQREDFVPPDGAPARHNGPVWEARSPWVTLRCERYPFREGHWRVTPIEEPREET